MSSSLSTIPENTFENCIALTSFEIPNHITAIKEKAFYNTSLISLSIPSTVTSIEANSFSSNDNDKVIIYQGN